MSDRGKRIWGAGNSCHISYLLSSSMVIYDVIMTSSWRQQVFTCFTFSLHKIMMFIATKVRLWSKTCMIQPGIRCRINFFNDTLSTACECELTMLILWLLLTVAQIKKAPVFFWLTVYSRSAAVIELLILNVNIWVENIAFCQLCY